jgi:mono/diheme cytochrome c family protein
MKTMLRVKMVALLFLSGFALCRLAGAADVTDNWNVNCAACHGKDGKGQTMMGRKLDIKDFTDPKFQASFDDAQATKTIKEGKKDKDGKTLMKPFGDKFSDEEIKALVASVRGFNK